MRGARARPPVSIQEHMAIDVCPGPIRPIRRISDYFPRRPDIWTQCSGGLGPQAPGGGSQGLERRTSTKDEENGDDIRDHIEDSGEEDDDEDEEEHEDVDEVFGAYAEATKAMTPRMEKKTSVGSTSWNNPLLSPRATQASHHSLLMDPGDPDDSDDTSLLGELEFRLMYDANSHILHCHILRAQVTS
uniref:Uncharacterized protein n=1 Tax=Eptatretus burgeri TaxID=7764 RepID=A0A8C4R930_EPTBU